MNRVRYSALRPFFNKPVMFVFDPLKETTCTPLLDIRFRKSWLHLCVWLIKWLSYVYGSRVEDAGVRVERVFAARRRVRPSAVRLQLLQTLPVDDVTAHRALVTLVHQALEQQRAVFARLAGLGRGNDEVVVPSPRLGWVYPIPSWEKENTSRKSGHIRFFLHWTICGSFTNYPDRQMPTSLLSSPLKEKWRMLWAFQWSELNSRSRPIAFSDDADWLASGHWLPIRLIRG